MGQVTDSSPHSSFLISHDLCKHSKGDTLVTADRSPAAVPRQKRIKPVPPTLRETESDCKGRQGVVLSR